MKARWFGCLLIGLAVLATTAFGQVDIVDGRLSLSATIGTDDRWYLLSRSGFAETRTDFRIRAARCEFNVTPGDHYRLAVGFRPGRFVAQDTAGCVCRVLAGFRLEHPCRAPVVPGLLEGQEEIQDRRFVDYSAVNIWVIPTTTVTSVSRRVSIWAPWLQSRRSSTGVVAIPLLTTISGRTFADVFWFGRLSGSTWNSQLAGTMAVGRRRVDILECRS